MDFGECSRTLKNLSRTWKIFENFQRHDPSDKDCEARRYDTNIYCSTVLSFAYFIPYT